MLDLEKLIFSDFFTVNMNGKLGFMLARKGVKTYICTIKIKVRMIIQKVWIILYILCYGKRTNNWSDTAQT